MNKYFAQLAYKGTNYHGWQSQPNAVSVQEIIEENLAKLMGTKTEVVGCGRTDTGVHANDYYLHFEAEQLKYSLAELVFKLNNMLPVDISFKRIFEVNSSAHARFDAVSREYRYYLHQQKNPFLEEVSWYFPKTLNIQKMQEAGNILLKYKDFTSFSKLHTDNKTNFCEISNFVINELPDQKIEIVIVANRFLRNMVRSIVGTLIDVGLNKISLTDFEDIIVKKNRAEAGMSAPAKGLFLHRIEYPNSVMHFDGK